MTTNSGLVTRWDQLSELFSYCLPHPDNGLFIAPGVYKNRVINCDRVFLQKNDNRRAAKLKHTLFFTAKKKAACVVIDDTADEKSADFYLYDLTKVFRTHGGTLSGVLRINIIPRM